MSTVPVVGDRKILDIENVELYKQVDNALSALLYEFAKDIPLSLTYPGVVDGKVYIIATVDLPNGIPVHEMPVEFKGFPVLVDYRAIRPSSGL
ncbi:uncharacterized protein OCT59_012832 [Rhizophagus irregularis]|uniref:Uncharacterized protein n=1 Tax=Rhizophagus irregularis (strain DAOM 197198w) TaxID=1432141 RepID=A0A015JJK2_RHIIW|nr:hypothetical protein RirG_228220 [Rhizophagus irregularis DAOM 197198w]UZO20408.1 hypothetical protein OCT59_012832 [Rhizophagus irregularis]GBC32035.1 hypothetical protein GLOIN_2v1782623 [Rhizophagus irregularis DAOM 181602=DAOM 197198]